MVAHRLRLLVADDRVVRRLGQLLGRGRRVGVLVDLRLPAPRHGGHEAAALDHRQAVEQRPGELLGEVGLGRDVRGTRFATAVSAAAIASSTSASRQIEKPGALEQPGQQHQRVAQRRARRRLVREDAAAAGRPCLATSPIGPPVVMTATGQRRSSAVDSAVIVSSVAPECDTAMTSVDWSDPLGQLVVAHRHERHAQAVAEDRRARGRRTRPSRPCPAPRPLSPRGSDQGYSIRARAVQAMRIWSGKVAIVPSMPPGSRRPYGVGVLEQRRSRRSCAARPSRRRPDRGSRRARRRRSPRRRRAPAAPCR